MKILISFFLFFISSELCFANNKILLTGRPVVLIPRNDYYLFPKAYSPITDYHFVDISGDNRVCFLRPQAKLNSLDMLKIYIEEDKKFLWFCYRYNPAFFEVDF